MAMGAAVLFSAVVLLFGPYIYRIFTPDDEVIADGMRIVRTLGPLYFTYVCVEVISGTVRGTGDSLWPMIITCLGVCVGRILWILAVVPQIHTLETLVLGYPLPGRSRASCSSLITCTAVGCAVRFKRPALRRSSAGAARAPGVKAAHIA